MNHKHFEMINKMRNTICTQTAMQLKRGRIRTQCGVYCSNIMQNFFLLLFLNRCCSHANHMHIQEDAVKCAADREGGIKKHVLKHIIRAREAIKFSRKRVIWKCKSRVQATKYQAFTLVYLIFETDKFD